MARVRTQVRRKRYQDRLKDNFLHNISLALTDPLTGLYNRRYFFPHLQAVMGRMADIDKPVSLLMIDIDHFKAVNDRYGHTVGDRVLREIAERIGYNVRGFDLAARYGGEEFVVVMPDTSVEVALAVADRLREKIAEVPVATTGAAEELGVTVSIGVAETRGKEESFESLLRRADEALYRAKGEGRNRVVPRPPTGVKIREDAKVG